MPLNTLITNTYILTENITNGYTSEWLELISILAISLGILTIISKNSIFSVLNLIGLVILFGTYLYITISVYVSK